MWLTWIHHNLSPKHDSDILQIDKLFIYRLKLNWQIDVDVMQRLREKTGLVEAHWLRAAARSEHFLEFLRWSSQQAFR